MTAKDNTEFAPVSSIKFDRKKCRFYINFDQIRDNSQGGFLAPLSDGSGRDNEKETFEPLKFIQVSEVTVTQRTDAVIRGLLLVLEHHDAPASVQSELDLQLHSYLDSSKDEQVWLKRCKYVLTYPIAKYLRNELPPVPDVTFRPMRSLRSWMKPRLAFFNRKNTHLWYSWLQSKRCSLPASKKYVKETYKKHRATLTKDDVGVDSTIDRVFNNPVFQRLLSRVRKYTMKKFNKMRKFENFSASSSACYENTRAGGGQHRELYSQAEDVESGPLRNWMMDELEYVVADKEQRIVHPPSFVMPTRQCRLIDEALSESQDPWNTELYRMDLHSVVFGKTARYNVVSEVRCVAGYDTWRHLKYSKASYNASRPIRCMIQAVLEPMKVRVISKGEALPYYICRPLQKALHSSMRHMPCFRLIGRPFDASDLMDLARNASPTDVWFSIDYSAATDNLSWKYSRRIFEFLIAKLPVAERDIALKVLGPHALHYPGKKNQDQCWMQRTGQLMGSVLSFPILCLANMGVYLDVTDQSQRRWKDKDRLQHVLVNGDDMLYAADLSLWDVHQKVAAEVGLDMSLGKAYHHPEYANVNSVSVHHDLRRSDATPFQIGYLNAGLFFGQHKVQDAPRGDEMKEDDEKDSLICRVADPQQTESMFASAHLSQDPERGLAVNLNTLLSGSLETKKISLLRKFLDCHKAALRRETALVVRRGGKLSLETRNIFLPVEYGGLGIVPPKGWLYKTTKTQLQIAYAYANRDSCPRTSQRPLPGYVAGKLETVATVPWCKEFPEQEILSISTTISQSKRREVKRGFVRYIPNKLGVVA